MENVKKIARFCLNERVLTLFSLIIMAYTICGLWNMFYVFEISTVMLVFLFIGYALFDFIAEKMGKQWLRYILFAVISIIFWFVFQVKELRQQYFIFLLLYVAIKVVHKIDILRKGFVIGVVFGLVCAYVMDKYLPKMLVIWIFVLCLKEIVSLHNIRQGVGILPFILLMGMILFVLPTPENPFDWSFVSKIGTKFEDIWKQVVAEVKYRFEEDSVFEHMTGGYGAFGKIGGKIGENDTVELYVYPRDTRGNLYITADIYATLTDKQWKKAKDIPNLYNWYATYLNLLYQTGISRQEAKCFSKVCKTKISYGYLKTKTVFHQMNMLRIEDGVLADMTEDKQSFTLRRAASKDYNYYITYMDFDYANPYLLDLLKRQDNQPMTDYETLDQYSFELYNIYLHDSISKENFEQIATKEQNDYLEVSGVSDKTKDLAKDITKDCDSAFDKCKAVERYLRNYKYSKNVDLRKYDNFIEGFLFEEKQGYCVHYASAMVMLLRLNGIPARYVEGYLCDYATKNDEEVYEVTGSKAHSWVEAYIEGFGWVRFEPTASYADAESLGWNLRVKKETGKKDTPKEVTAPDYAKQTATAKSDGNKATENSNININLKKIIGLILCMFVGLVVLLVMLHLLQRKVSYKRKTELEQMKSMLRDICYLINGIYDIPLDNKPLLEYADCILENEVKNMVETAFLLYYKMCYSHRKAEASMQAQIQDTENELHTRYIYKEKRGVWKRKLELFWKMEADYECRKQHFQNS